MSSASYAVTYTSVYTDSEPGMPVAPLSPDYIPGPEEPQTPPVSQDEDEREPMFIQPHDPDYMPEPMYPEYIPLEDEYVLLEYEDDETEDVLVDYPMDGGDDGDDDDGDSYGNDANDEDEDEEEEEHLAPADFAIVIPTVELVSLPEETEPVIPPPFTDTTTTRARINVRLQAAISLPPEAEVERLLHMPTPPPSPLTSLSPPSAGERLARDTWVDPAEAVLEIAPMTLGEVNNRVTKLAELHEHDTQDLYTILEDAQDSRTRISQQVTMDSHRVDLLIKDRIAHQETILIVEEEAYAARES
uniref:Uncharacterized protein n=1 Tax=Tanacetum cinerariifolium TaxID=118510 RepID=A0A699J8J5_TANCI|nr:hypothetical protein [Tanacetum cinerariifolium]